MGRKHSKPLPHASDLVNPLLILPGQKWLLLVGFCGGSLGMWGLQKGWEYFLSPSPHPAHNLKVLCFLMKRFNLGDSLMSLNLFPGKWALQTSSRPCSDGLEGRGYSSCLWFACSRVEPTQVAGCNMPLKKRWVCGTELSLGEGGIRRKCFREVTFELRRD